MTNPEVKRPSKWRRYFNIIVGISNSKEPRKSSTVNILGSDPSSYPKGILADRMPNETVTTVSGIEENGELLYCVR